MKELLNICLNLARPALCLPGLQKLGARMRGAGGDHASRLALTWAKNSLEGDEQFATQLDARLWQEAQDYWAGFAPGANARLHDLRSRGIILGGGGHGALIYFLVRYYRPRIVLETGVAGGFTSHAILSALQANDSGHLLSSDLPYFRLRNPETLVGLLVDERLRSRWKLALRGDRINLPQMLASIDTQIDLVHYDSDKSFGGRKFVLDMVRDRLSDGAVVIMDDIQDDLFFRDYVSRHELQHHVFRFEGKYLGLFFSSGAAPR